MRLQQHRNIEVGGATLECTVIDIPIGHKDRAWSVAHFDTMTVSIADSPRSHEILVAIVVADGGRLDNRCGTEPIRWALQGARPLRRGDGLLVADSDRTWRNTFPPCVPEQSGGRVVPADRDSRPGDALGCMASAIDLVKSRE